MQPQTFRLLSEADVEDFVCVERVCNDSEQVPGGEPGSPQARQHKIFLRGARNEELVFSQKPFDVGVATIKDALVLARPFESDLKNGNTESGFYRYDGDHIILSLDGYTYSDLLFRSHGIPRRFALDDAAQVLIAKDELPYIANVQTGDTIFLGDFHGHFGHLLVEGLNRLWFLSMMTRERRKRARYLFFKTWSEPEDAPLPWYILKFYDIEPEQVIITDKPMRFERLTIPSPAQRPFVGWDLYYSRTMEALYRALGSSISSLTTKMPEIPKRIYLSRERFAATGQGRRSLISSAYVEKKFRSAGYTIIYPETLDFGQQVSLARHAEKLAGPSGSAQHLAAFAQDLESQAILSPLDFFLPIADLSFTMYKGPAYDGANLTYYFGQQRDQHHPPLEADWDIHHAVFDEWFESTIR